MPVQVISPGSQNRRRPRRLRARQGSGTNDLLTQALFQGFDSLGQGRDQDFQLELLGQQLQNQLELQGQGQQGTLDVIAAQGTRAETESALDRKLARQALEEQGKQSLAAIAEGNKGNLEAINAGLVPQREANALLGRQIDQQGKAQDVSSLAILEQLRSQKRGEQLGNLSLKRGILENEAQAAESTAVGGRQQEAALAQQSPINFADSFSQAVPDKPSLFPGFLGFGQSDPIGNKDFEGLSQVIADLGGQIDVTSGGPLQRSSAIDNAIALQGDLQGRQTILSRLGIMNSNETPFLAELEKLLSPEKVAKIRRAASEFGTTPESAVRAEARAPFDQQIRANATKGLELGTGGVEGLDAAIQKLQQGIGGQTDVNPQILTPTTPPDQQTTEEVILGPTPGDQVGAASPFIGDLARKLARRNLLQQGLIA